MKQLFVLKDKTLATDTTATNIGRLLIEYFENDNDNTPADPINLGLVTKYGVRNIEVTRKLCRVTKFEYKAATAFTASCTVPTPTDNTDYTLTLVKKDAMINERNQWSATDYVPAGVVRTAEQIATSLANQLGNKVAHLGITVQASGANITVTAPAGELWTLVGGDGLMSTVTIATQGLPAIGDAAYMKNLASQCAAGKGFNYTDAEGKEIYPGYPEAFADNAKYDITNIHFATTRVAGHQTDEPIWQDLFIAYPHSN